MPLVTTPNNSTATKVLEKIQALKPTHVELVNESMQHAGYFDGKESHFKMTIASEVFVNKRLIARHQQIYALVNELMTAQNGTIHALALHTYTPDEWHTLQNDLQQSPTSPQCAGVNR